MRKLLLLAVLLVAGPVFAQVGTAVVTGTVQDPDGAVIPTATITITNQATGISTTVKAGQQGEFTSPPLQVGPYSVTASAPGFQSQSQTGIALEVQQRLNIPFKLVVGQATQNVVVTTAPLALQTETSSLGQVITSSTMTNLPLDGRDYTQLASLSTGVVSTAVGTNGNTGGNTSGRSNSFSADGTRGTLNNFLLDGIDNNSNDYGGVLLRTSVDAIEQFKVQTNSYSAEFGRSGGAVINAVIKSGTNQYHGSLFEFFRNSALDARDYFESPSARKSSFKQNQFGGTIGGPIIRGKLFWFGDYQGTSIHQPKTFISTVPTAAERTGDFSATGETIYDPDTYDASTGTRTAFSGGVIPQDRIDQLAQQYVNLYPLPNQPGLTNNFLITPTQNDLINQGDFRADYHPSQADQVFFRWSMSGRTYVAPSRLPGLANGGPYGAGNNFEDMMGAALGETHTFSPNIINQFLVGFNWEAKTVGGSQGGNQPPPDNLKVPGVDYAPGTAGPTQFYISGYRSIGYPGDLPTKVQSEERQISDTLNIIHGKQTIAIGAEIRWSQYNIFQLPQPNGAFTFTGQFTQDPSSGDGGDGLADVLLGLPQSSTINTQVKVRNRQYVPSAFFQDDYKVSQKLVLNLGVRYAYFSPTVSLNDQQSNFDYKTGQLVVAGQNGASRGLVKVDHFNFSPRVGFAATLFKNTVLSSAYGIFFSGQEIRTAAPLQLSYNLPFYYQPTFISDGITPILTVSGGFPALNPLDAPDPGVTSVDARLKTPYYQEWNLSIQQGLPARVVLGVAYAGSKGTHLQAVADRNQVMEPGPGDVQSRRPYPNLGGFTSIENRANSTYNSLQVKVERQASHGLYLLSSFTWSKAFDDQPSVCCDSPWPQNSWDIPADRGLSDANQTLRWVVSYDYELPVGRGISFLGSTRAADALLRGWHLSGIYSLASGFPFTPTIDSDPSNTGSQGMQRPNQIGSGALPSGKRGPNNWFNIDAYTVPAPYTFGNARRNSLVGPGVNNWDSALRKTFSIHEAQSVEFRAEFFNVLNHPDFGMPDSTVTDGPGAAGVITDTALANREIQLGLKYRY
jgi:hypothetical protein